MNNAAAKFNMIEQQIRPWEVLDHRVLNTFNEINRELFVPDIYLGLAYADCQIPLLANVRMLPPTIEGRLLQALLIKPEDNVLEIGSASGFVTACLAHLGSHVTSVDSHAEIIELAQKNISHSGATNVEFSQSSIDQLDQTHRYDAIALTASVAELPEAVKRCLKIGGRLFAVVGQSPVMQALLVTRVSESEWSTRSLFETDLPRLVG